MMSLMLVVIVLKAIQVVDTSGVHIHTKGEIQEGNNITLECSTSAKDLTFSFQSTVGEYQDVNVAECVFRDLECFFLKEAFLAMFSIYLTDNGGILIIHDLSTKQYGVYTCWETYNPKNKASVRVEGNSSVRVEANGSVNIAINNTVIVCIGIGVPVCLIVIIIIIYCIRQKTHRGPELHNVPRTQRGAFDDIAGGPERHPVPSTNLDVSEYISGGPVIHPVTSTQRDAPDDIAGCPELHHVPSTQRYIYVDNAGTIIHAFPYTELNNGNTQPSIDKCDRAPVQNGPDECTTGMQNINTTISDQEMTMPDANDEQQNIPLLENVSENINDIGPIFRTTVEIKLETAENQHPEVEHLSAASSFFVQNIHEDEDGVHIDNTGQDQLHASEMTGQIRPDDDPNDSIESHQPPGTTSLYRSGQKIQITHRGTDRDNQYT